MLNVHKINSLLHRQCTLLTDIHQHTNISTLIRIHIFTQKTKSTFEHFLVINNVLQQEQGIVELFT